MDQAFCRLLWESSERVCGNLFTRLVATHFHFRWQVKMQELGLPGVADTREMPAQQLDRLLSDHFDFLHRIVESSLAKKGLKTPERGPEVMALPEMDRDLYARAGNRRGAGGLW